MNRTSISYLLYTFSIMLLCWGICVLCSVFGFSLTVAPILYIPFLLGGFSPTIASYIVLKKSQKVAGFKQWLKINFDFKHSVTAYLPVPLFAAAFMLPLCAISGYEKGVPLLAIIFMMPVMLFGGGLEETGWRGILQPELEKKLGFAFSALLVSIIWWLWHLPLFFIRGTSQYGANFLIYGIQVLGLSFALGAIRKRTGSVWLCILFHCLVNSLRGVFLVKENIFGSLAATLILIAVSCVLVYIRSGARNAQS